MSGRDPSQYLRSVQVSKRSEEVADRERPG